MLIVFRPPYEELYNLVDHKENTSCAAIMGIKTQAGSAARNEAIKPICYGRNLNSLKPEEWEVIMDGNKLSIGSLRFAVSGVLKQAENLMESLLSGVNIKKFPDIKDLSDELQNEKPDVSFLSLNQGLLSGFQKNAFPKFYKNHGVMKTNPATGDNFLDVVAVRRILEGADLLMRCIFFLVHTTCGHPGRATEECCLRYVNKPNAPRNLYIMEETFAICPLYNKTDSNQRAQKVIFRFLPRDVSNLLLKYLALIRPIVS
jgi:hypothetical protein